MMRPTASSANKVQEKADIKSPPRRTPSLLKKQQHPSVKPRTPKFEKTDPKANGAAHQNGDAVAGASTPHTEPAAHETADNQGLEATPAFEAETIR